MKIAVLIDGGHLRAEAQNANKVYDCGCVTAFARSCAAPDEYLFRIFYYDAPPYSGSLQLPVSGNYKKYNPTNQLLEELEREERFAVRRGSLGFRGWKPRNIPLPGGNPLTDDDFKPIFEQKGVDMRVGLDIATFAENRSVDRIVLVSGDQDMIPAMKRARIAGLEMVLVQLPHPAKPLHKGLLAHTDLIRQVTFP